MPQIFSEKDFFEVIDEETLEKAIELYNLDKKLVIKSSYDITKLLSIKYYKRMLENIYHKYGDNSPKFVLDVEDNLGFYLEAIDSNFKFILVKENLFKKGRLLQRAKSKNISVFFSIDEFFE